MVEAKFDYRLFSVLITLITINMVCAAEFGVLLAKSSQESNTQNFCIMYYPKFATLPVTMPEEFTPISDERVRDWCKTQIESTSSSSFASMKGSIVLSKPWNCSLAQKAKNVKLVGGKALLVVTTPGAEPHEIYNSTDEDAINITVALISDNSALRLLNMGSDIRAVMFSPSSSSLDYGLLIIWLVAVFTVAVGSYWSGLLRQSLYNSELGKLSDLDSNNDQTPAGVENNGKRDSLAEESALNVSPVLITFFVVCMGVLLLLLYFFFDYLVYAVIIVFVIGSMLSVYSCLEPLVLMKKCDFCKLPEFTFLKCFQCALDVREILLFAFAASLSITWVVLRKESYSWVLQDILGVAFSIHLLKSMRLPSLKICSLFLVLLFFYDIFFVFITPYLTVKGDSVMVEVATGGTSKEQRGKSQINLGGTEGTLNEQIPMVLRVPHLRSDLLKICSQPYSLLGFGDILVPGLLVSYCHGIDMFLNNKKIYYITGCIAYGVGLIMAFLGFYLMSSAQPALLYLVPATLIPTILIGWCRGELNLLWNGVKVGKPKSSESGGFTNEHHHHRGGGSPRTEGRYGTTTTTTSTSTIATANNSGGTLAASPSLSSGGPTRGGGGSGIVSTNTRLSSGAGPLDESGISDSVQSDDDKLLLRF